MYQDQENYINEIIKETYLCINKHKLHLEEIGEYFKCEYDRLTQELIRLNLDTYEYAEKKGEIEKRLKALSKMYHRTGLYNKDYEKFISAIYPLDQVTLGSDRVQECEEIDISLTRQNYNLKSDWGIKLIEAQEMERKRIANDMHDGPTQNLSNLLLKTEVCIKLMDKDMDHAKLELHSLKQLIRSTIDESRLLIHNLRPMSLDDLGLIPTMNRLLDELSIESNLKIRRQLFHYKNIEINPNLALSVYRISQEALNNIKKHASATKIEFDLRIEKEYLYLDIKDNGIGFSVDNMKSSIRENKNFGLSMMSERTVLLSGEFHIKSSLKQGTSISIKIPICK